MRRALLSVAAGAVLAAGPALAADPPADVQAQVRQAFAETDRNGDGRVDRDELHHRVVDIFYRSDVDKDGYLTREDVARLLRSNFEELDANGDGRVGLHEFADSRFESFEAADADDNGVLTLDEALATLATGD